MNDLPLYFINCHNEKCAYNNISVSHIGKQINEINEPKVTQDCYDVRTFI